MRIIYAFFWVMLFLPLTTVWAYYDQISVYDQIGVASYYNTQIPKVVKVKVPNILQGEYEVFDLIEENFVYGETVSIEEKRNSLEVYFAGNNNPVSTLSDMNVETFEILPFEEGISNSYNFSFKNEGGRALNSLSFSFPENVKNPTNISLKADGKIISYQENFRNPFTFPLTPGNNFEVALSYEQPLRISDISTNSSIVSGKQTYVLFLYQPNHMYHILHNPKGLSNNIPFEEKPINLSFGNATFLGADFAYNPEFENADQDGDTIPDKVDNCPKIANIDQKDIDGNLIGDACEDFDKDGIWNYRDNCRDNPNSDQKDDDFDGLGNVCDEVESRFFEKNQWISWVAIIFSIGVVTGLIYKVYKDTKSDKDPENF